MDGMSRLLLHKIQKSIVFQWTQTPWCGLLLPAHILATYGWVSESVGGVLKGWRVTFEPVVKSLPDGVRKLVLCAHDESTMQANDSDKAGWGPEDEQPLLKKSVGHGSHQSDVICSTVGWLEEAGQQLEYRKDYDRYWTGELLVKQVRILRALLAITNNFLAERKNNSCLWKGSWPSWVSSTIYGW